MADFKSKELRVTSKAWLLLADWLNQHAEFAHSLYDETSKATNTQERDGESKTVYAVPGVLRMLRIQGHHYAFDFCVVFKCVLAFLTPPTACLESSEGASHVKVVIAIDPDCSCLQLMGS